MGDQDDKLHIGGAFENPVAELLAAAAIQKRALEWKCKLAAVPIAAKSRARGVFAKKVPVGPLIEFLEEAAAVGDALDAHIVLLSKHRQVLVDSLKASTEVSAWESSSTLKAGQIGGA